jgi:hypothetical protein
MRRACWVLLALAAGCGRRGFGDFDAAPDTAAFAARKRITVAPGTDLADFPLSIVTVDADLQRTARSDGLDIVFTADDNTVLDHELVDYDSATGSLEAWVRVPALSVTGTTLWMYYGGDARTPAAAATWSGYSAVWHMSGTGNTERDSTEHANDLHAISAPSQPTPALGIIGGARDYDGMSNAMVASFPVDGSLDFGTRSFRFGAWVRVMQSAGEFDIVFYKGASNVSLPGYDMELGTSGWVGCIGDGVTNACTSFGTEPQFLGQWTYLMCVADRSANELLAYVNGVQTNAFSIAGLGSTDSTFGLSVGYSPTVFKGLLDEPRVLEGAASPEVIRAEYMNVMSRSMFTLFGPHEAQ